MKNIVSDSLSINELIMCVDKAGVESYSKVRVELVIKIKTDKTIQELLLPNLKVLNKVSYSKFVLLDNLLKKGLLTIRLADSTYYFELKNRKVYERDRIYLYADMGTDIYDPVELELSEEKIYEKKLSDLIRKYSYLTMDISCFLQIKNNSHEKVKINQFKDYAGEMEEYRYSQREHIIIFSSEEGYLESLQFHNENNNDKSKLISYYKNRDIKKVENPNLNLLKYYQEMYDDLTIKNIFNKELFLFIVSDLKLAPIPKQLPDPNKDIRYHTRRRVHGYRT